MGSFWQVDIGTCGHHFLIAPQSRPLQLQRHRAGSSDSSDREGATAATGRERQQRRGNPTRALLWDPWGALGRDRWRQACALAQIGLRIKWDAVLRPWATAATGEPNQRRKRSDSPRQQRNGAGRSDSSNRGAQLEAEHGKSSDSFAYEYKMSCRTGFAIDSRF